MESPSLRISQKGFVLPACAQTSWNACSPASGTGKPWNDNPQTHLASLSLAPVALPIIARNIPAKHFTSALAEAAARWGGAELITGGAGAVKAASTGALALAGGLALLAIGTLGLVIYNEANGGSADIFHWWGDALFDYLHPEDKEPAKEPPPMSRVSGNANPSDPAADEKEFWHRFERARQLINYDGMDPQRAFGITGIIDQISASGSRHRTIGGTVASSEGGGSPATVLPTSGDENDRAEPPDGDDNVALRRIGRAPPSQLPLPGATPQTDASVESLFARTISPENKLLRGAPPEATGRLVEIYPLAAVIAVGCNADLNDPQLSPAQNSYAVASLMEALLPGERSLANDYRLVQPWHTRDFEFARARLKEQYPWLASLKPPRESEGFARSDVELARQHWLKEQAKRFDNHFPVVPLKNIERVSEIK